MKLGLIADIHEDVPHLRMALAQLHRECVDQVVVLGDLCVIGTELEATCQLLLQANAVGVWGNHDFGLCGELAEDVRNRYPPAVLQFMGSLRPRLQIEDCHFTHVEPWLDPTELADLWYFDDIPNSREALTRIFAMPYRLMFAGHYHRWLMATPQGVDTWLGDRPIRLNVGERYFVVIGALCEGRFAIYDTRTSELTPFNASLRNAS